jgi:hypothetical protein
MYGGESLDHAMFKVSIAAHLVTWGYHWEQIHWETTPERSPHQYRPDLYADGSNHLPSFWFECVGTEQEKLTAVANSLPDFRVVRVVDLDWFIQFWNGKAASLDIPAPPNQVEDPKERKKLIIQQRQAIIPPGVECWVMRGRENAPRIIYAVRREQDNQFVYLDSGEGWSLSSIRYVSKRPRCFQPLIPGIVGHAEWRGENSDLFRDQAV